MMPIPSLYGKLVLFFLLFSGTLFNNKACADEKVYTVGVLNQQSVVATARLWNPLLLYLGRKTGARFTLAIGGTVQETDARTAKGEFDLAYTNHIFYMPIQREYRPIVRWGRGSLRGLLVSLKPWRLEDLAGKTIAFPSPQAFAATVLTWTQLEREQIRFRPLFTGSQQACMAALAKRLVDAAGVTTRFATPYARRHGLDIHVIYRSAPFPQIPLLIHTTRVPDGLAERIRAVLLNMPQDEEGKELLANLDMPPFEPADDALYAGTREVYSRWRHRAAAAESR